MKYLDDYMYSKDIDWFCIINKFYVHVASAGSLLPEIINDRNKLRKIQKQVFDLPYIFDDNDIIINDRFINERFNNNEDISNYLSSFIDMARKGFVSMDRTNLQEPDDQTYHIVCMPNKIIQLDIEIIKIEGLFFEPNEPIGNIKLLEMFKKE